VPWCVSGAALGAALTAADDARGLGYGVVTATRTRAYAPGRADDDGWDGGYAWDISFAALAEALPLVSVVLGAVAADGGAAFPAAAAPPAATDEAAVAVAEVRAGSAAGAANEVQLIDCACGAGGGAACSDAAGAGAAPRGVRLSWRGETTGWLPPGADAAAVRAALAALPSLPDVRVRLYGGATLCSAAGTTTAVTFSHSPGPQPPLHLARGAADVDLPAGAALALRAAPAAGAYGGRARRGTRALLECAGRGTCERSTGVCACVGDARGPAFGPSDGGGGADAAPGDGSALPFWSPRKVAANCARPLPAPAGGAPRPCACARPGETGRCAPGAAACVCAPGWAGARCDVTACPVSHASFFDVPRRAPGYAAAPLVAHAPAVCGNMGVCAAPGGAGTSACACLGGWSGAACSVAPCPGGGGAGGAGDGGAATCASGAPCVTMERLTREFLLTGPDVGTPLAALPAARAAPAFVYAAPWDARVLRGCVCAAPPGGAAFRGPAALNWGVGGGLGCVSALPCAGGADPLARKAAYAAAPGAPPPARAATQRLTCRLTRGALTLRFRGAAARPLGARAVIFDAEADAAAWTRGGASLETALRSLHTLGAFTLVARRRGDGAGEGDDGADGGAWAVVEPRGSTRGALPAALCDANGTVAVDITFLPTGDAPPPLLRADVDAAGAAAGDAASVVALAEPDAAAAAAWRECNARGVCDGATGRCACAEGFGSSDGAGGPGQRGDCGWVQAAWTAGKRGAAAPTRAPGRSGVFK
jgi:hypothetical protein